MRFVTTGGSHPPRFAPYVNLITLLLPPPDTTGPRGETAALLEGVAAAGFEGVQHFVSSVSPDVDRVRPFGLHPTAEDAARFGLRVAGAGRVRDPDDVDAVVARWAEDGLVGGTLHAGSAVDDDATLDRYGEAVVAAADAHAMPTFLETHRATVTQDLWRCVALARRVSALAFNLDFSHWSTAGELPYDDTEAVLAYAEPVLERVGFVHARIGSARRIQEPLDDGDEAPFVAHHRRVWTAAFGHARRVAPAGAVVPFAVELLPPVAGYAMEVDDGRGGRREEVDRWEQALRLVDLGRRCFEDAPAVVPPTNG